MASGVDQGRLSLLLAVLEKRAGLPLYSPDVYINVAGGLELAEPAADLALCAAVASSARGVALDGNLAVMGEVGLAGEIRAVPQAERRIAECARLGFTKIVLPKGNTRGVKPPEGASLHGVDTLSQALSIILKN
jgi:DNA repair protein RadA/Sms